MEVYNSGERARILKSRINEFIQEEIKEIKELQKTNPNGACIKLLARYKELELPKTQAIKNAEEILGISPEEMLKIMKDYQAEQKKREAVQNEGVAIG